MRMVEQSEAHKVKVSWKEKLDQVACNRALTSSLLSILGMNWNSDCIPGLITQHHFLTSLMLLWLNRNV